MTRRSLRAVEDGELAAPAVPLTVTEAAERGTQRDLLVALRSRIAKTVESPDTPPRDLAALSKRLTDLSKEIAALDARAEGEGAAGVEVGDAAFDPQAV